METTYANSMSRSAPLSRSRTWPAFFHAFARLIGPYFRSEKKWIARGLTATLIVLTLAQVVIPVTLNIWSENLFDALETRSMGKFLFLLGILVLIICANVSIVTTHLRIKRRLQIDSRDWLTGQLVNEWMSSGRHYQLTHIPGEHDNPDGRIAEDIRIATEYAVDLAHSLFYCVLLLVSFTQILWVLSGPPRLAIGDISLYVPGHLVWVAFIYAAVGTSVALLLGRPLVRATDSRQTFEANFRFGLVHARENSLAIALVRGEPDERQYFRGLFRDAVKAWDRQTAALTNIFLYISSWSVLSQVFPVLVAAPRYITGTITLGILMQTAQAFQQMIAALSWPIDNLSKLADWRASVERVLGLSEGIDRLATNVSLAKGAMIEVISGDRPVLSFDDVSIATPDGNPVLSGLKADIAAGEHVLISGEPAAADKIFKVAAGLWPWGKGRVVLPKDHAIFFMPQRPYLPVGSLRNAIGYLAAAATLDNARLRAAVERVGLAHLISRLDEIETWEQVLTMGEQQRLGFARLMLHRPNWIFLQEATDALDPKGEDDMMQLLQEEFSQVSVITIGHHAGLERYHRRKFVLLRSNGSVVVRESSGA